METERQIRELEKAMNTTDNRRLYERFLAVKLVLEGHTRKEAGHTIGRDEHTVSHYVKNYCHNGIQGLVSKKQSGRPSRLTDEQEAELVQIVAYHTPEEVGFKSRANWTLAIVCDLILREWSYGYTQKGVAHPSPARTKLDPSDVYPQKSGFQETTGIFGRNLPEPKKNC